MKNLTSLIATVVSLSLPLAGCAPGSRGDSTKTGPTSAANATQPLAPSGHTVAPDTCIVQFSEKSTLSGQAPVVVKIDPALSKPDSGVAFVPIYHALNSPIWFSWGAGNSWAIYGPSIDDSFKKTSQWQWVLMPSAAKSDYVITKLWISANMTAHEDREQNTLNFPYGQPFQHADPEAGIAIHCNLSN